MPVPASSLKAVKFVFPALALAAAFVVPIALAQAAPVNPPSGTRTEIGESAVDAAALARFYQGRGSMPAWTGNAQADAEARLALQALSRGGEHGLDTSHYHLDVLTRRDAADAAAYDRLMTDAVLRYEIGRAHV